MEENKEGQKLYNWLHLAAGHAMIFANISWASTRQNLSLGFPTKRDSNQSPPLQRLPRISKLRIASSENANDKGADSLRGACAASVRLCCSQTTEDRFSRVKAQLTYVSIWTNSWDQNQNAPTLYINSLIWVHTACKKATVYFSKQRGAWLSGRVRNSGSFACTHTTNCL